jgi:hypothetical protein
VNRGEDWTSLAKPMQGAVKGLRYFGVFQRSVGHLLETARKAVPQAQISPPEISRGLETERTCSKVLRCFCLQVPELQLVPGCPAVEVMATDDLRKEPRARGLRDEKLPAQELAVERM